MRRFLRAPLLFAALGFGAGGARAGDALPAEAAAFAVEASTIPLSTATLSCDYMEFRSTDNAVLARGNAVLTSSGTRLASDEITLHTFLHVAEAHGRVRVNEGPMTVMADDIRYSWEISTGTLSSVYIQSGVWRVWAKRVVRLGPDLFRLERAAFTTCDLDPPHYHFRARRAKYQTKKRLSVSNVRFAAERDPIFYWPYYTKSLKNNAWTLTVDPGNSARNGYFAKTVLIVPVGENTRASVLWDHYSKSGNGFGGELAYNHPKVRGLLSGFTIEDRLTGTNRWNFRFGHWQQLAPRWAAQSNVAFQSDTGVNNTFVRDDYQRVRELGESDLALTYGGPALNGRIFVEHDRVFDAAANRFVAQKTILPQLSFQTSPLRLAKSNVYFNLSGNARNEYLRPSTSTLAPNPITPEKDRYRQFADGTASLRWRLPLGKKISVEPSAGATERWQSHQDLGTAFDPKDLTQGFGFTSANWRHRLTSALDYDLTHRYRVRWTTNTFRRDHAAADQGLVQNEASFFGSYRPSAVFWARATTAYDLRDTPNLVFQSRRQRFSPPSLELALTPRPWFKAFLRETVSLYPARKPQSTSANVRLGATDKTYFTTGMSYNVARPGAVEITQGAGFNLTSGWWLSGDVHYTATGPGRLNYYDKVEFREKNLIVHRDLHCWLVRVTYRERPGVNEIFLRVDMKTNLNIRQKAVQPGEEQFHPARDTRGEY